MLLGVDVGGTFTDAAVLDGDRLITAKSPTTPGDQSEGVMNAVRATGVDPESIDRFVHGMTVATNALLEGRIARTALFATEGFTDVEELRRQNRAALYRLCAEHPAPIVERELRVAVPERAGPDGVVRELDEDALRERIASLPRDVEAAAVCLLWGFLHPVHEARVAELLSELRPELHVSTSHQTAAVFREYERCSTTVVDAAVSPLMRDYLRSLANRAAEASLPEPEVMLSSGGVAGAEQAAAHGSWTVLSGPAGGAVAAAWMARRAGVGGAVCLDMGGTSCDVSVALGGLVAMTGERGVGGRALALPMVDVHTVGAGGGSIAWQDEGGALRVGPRSAGAEPGPAAYGRGGIEPTVTDANVVLGRLDPRSPLAGNVILDGAAAERAVGTLASALGMGLADCAAGIVRIASAEMARAVRVVTVERGIDPRELALVPFGGAGPLHAAAIAEELGITRIVIPHSSGVLSALGLLVSERRRDLAESVLLAGDALARETIAAIVDRLADRGWSELGTGDADVRASYDLRYAGQAFELTVPGDRSPDPAALRRSFDDAHRDRYGFIDDDAELELVTVRVALATPGTDPQLAEPSWPELPETGTAGIVELPGATLFVPSGWRVQPADGGSLLMERA